MEKQPEKCKYNLITGPAVREKMNALKILDQDICQVIDLGETSGRRVFDPEKGTYICYRELGHITCWVEYRITEGQAEVFNVYTHRMKIELEAVWNGRKTDIDQ